MCVLSFLWLELNEGSRLAAVGWKCAPYLLFHSPSYSSVIRTQESAFSSLAFSFLFFQGGGGWGWWVEGMHFNGQQAVSWSGKGLVHAVDGVIFFPSANGVPEPKKTNLPSPKGTKQMSC
jgi:hypothetical protein